MTVKKLMMVVVIVLSGCGWVKDDAAYIQERSEKYYEQRGFKVLGYQGYNMWAIGRCYWYTLEKNGTTFESCLVRWGDEIHEYCLRAVDAIKGEAG
jgi:hypothetical protein